MRSDFSNQNNKERFNQRRLWNKRRIIRGLVFILLGLAIGFWIHNHRKHVPPTDSTPQKLAMPKQITEPVALPGNEIT